MSTVNSSIRTIAVVSSKAFDFQRPDEDEFDEAIPPGEDFANFVLNRLNARGVKPMCSPVSGEGGWTFDVQINQTRYLVFIHWAPIGSPPNDRWVIQPDLGKGIIRAIFGSRTKEQEVMPIVNELEKALNGVSEFDSITWVTREEFNKMY